MKKIVCMLLGAGLLVSCGKSKAEQMLFDYQQDNVKNLNVDLNDLDFNIEKIDKVKDITAADSIKDLKVQFATYWKTDPEQGLIDTLSFKFVKSVLNKTIAQQDTLQKLYQEAVLTAIRLDDISYRYESERKRDEAIDELYSYKETLNKIESLEKRYDALSEKTDSILSTEYAATYSLKNPMLGNTKQTFNKIFYTDAAQTKFVKSKSADDK